MDSYIYAIFPSQLRSIEFFPKYSSFEANQSSIFLQFQGKLFHFKNAVQYFLPRIGFLVTESFGRSNFPKN